MVHLRLNEKEVNPNPHINFISPLRTEDSAAEEEARQLLRALAAQVRPVMKAEGFVVNSFEEYEHNKVFAGRNWNNGEVVELVLRGAGGGFLPTSWLLSTLCHELAHIKHMNHGPAFHALWAKLRNDVRELQSKGYYGDGYWSSGTRLADSAHLGSQGLDAGDLPEYMCGGAQARARPTSLRRRRRRQQPGGPSNHTGAQTAKRRKAGSRVTAQGTFAGAGRALNEDVSDEEEKKAGAGFRKKAASKKARDARALAAERRLLALQGSSAAAKKEESDDGDDAYEPSAETDQDRRRAMLDSTEKGELEDMKITKKDFFADFILPPANAASGSAPASSSRHAGTSSRPAQNRMDIGTIELSSDDDFSALPACDIHSLPRGGTAASSGGSTKGKAVGKQADLGGWLQTSHSDGRHPTTKKTGALSYGALVQDEVRKRTKESLGMSGDGRRLGVAPSREAHSSREDPRPSAAINSEVADKSAVRAHGEAWACQVCTLVNDPQHLACSVCATPRGEEIWSGNPL
ncbi:WLM domain-containing protein [Trametes elegans]|nr:WLM domain-containing protein [Trametes elegans]